MPEPTVTLTDDGELKTLKAQVENLQKQLTDKDDKLVKEKERAETAERELRERELIRLENHYEIQLKELIEKGNGAPAYIELGVHKALRAMDAHEVKVELGGKETPASEIILKALKAVPKFIEHKEVVKPPRPSASGDEPDPPGDDRFSLAMKQYEEGGKVKVTGLDVKALTDKLMKDEKLGIEEATLKASRMLAGGAK